MGLDVLELWDCGCSKSCSGDEDGLVMEVGRYWGLGVVLEIGLG